MIPFGAYQPDTAGVNTKVLLEARNVLPIAGGMFGPLKAPLAATTALDDACQGAVVVLKDDGNAAQYAGDANKLYKLAVGAWSDVSRTSGGAYATALGDRWKFTLFGTSVIATNYTDDVQFIDVVSGTNFAALAGSPPKARFIDVVRDQVWLGAVNGTEKRVHWSGLNDASFWTPGTQSCDYQDAASGGPIRGIIGGAQAWIFQQQRVTRATFTPGSTAVYQFDEVQGGKGIAAQNTLVRVGDMAWYYSSDGPYEFAVSSGGTQPIGVGKWRQSFINDIRAGTEYVMQAAADPVHPIVMFAYVSRDNGTLTPDRVLIYDWSLKEATFADISVEAMTTWLSSGVTLDTMNSFGTLDTLPFSLDSPYWKGGASLVGIFGTDHKLYHLQGQPMAATFITADGSLDARTFLTGLTPVVDTPSITAAVHGRERDGDTVTFGVQEAMEDTGEIPCHISGNYVRAKLQIPSGTAWTLMQGIRVPDPKKRGKR